MDVRDRTRIPAPRRAARRPSGKGAAPSRGHFLRIPEPQPAGHRPRQWRIARRGGGRGLANGFPGPREERAHDAPERRGDRRRGNGKNEFGQSRRWRALASAGSGHALDCELTETATAGEAAGELVGKQTPNLRSEIGFATLRSGANGTEIDEPVVENDPRHRLESLVHAPVEFDLVVERTQDVGDGALLREGRQRNFNAIGCPFFSIRIALCRWRRHEIVFERGSYSTHKTNTIHRLQRDRGTGSQDGIRKLDRVRCRAPERVRQYRRVFRSLS